MNCHMCGQPSENAAHDSVTECLRVLGSLTQIAVHRWMDRQAMDLARAFAEAEEGEEGET